MRWVTRYACAWLAWLGFATVAAAQVPAGSITGTVLDTRGGGPVSSVSIRLQSTGAQTLTDEQGRFAFEAVAAGNQELYVSAVDFILIKRTVVVTAGAATNVTIALAEGTGTYTEAVQVSGTQPPVRRDSAVAASQALAGRELQALRGVLANDPLRAVQMLPAVAAGDDFRSDFAIRGTGLQQMTFSFEGIATPFLLHTVQQVHDSGSVAMVNGDVLDEISVANGSYPQRFGNRIGAEIDFLMREGSRERLKSHVAASAIDTSAVVEGPIGAQKRGSWLATARKSYLDLIVNNLYPEQNISFGFVDTQAKVVYDINARHQLQLATTAGRSRLERKPDALGAGNLQSADNQSVLSVLTWRYLPSPRFTLDQRAAVIDNTFTNESRDGTELDGGSARDFVYRADASFPATASMLLEGGGELRRSAAAGREQRLAGGRFQTRESFDAAVTNASAYVQARLTGVHGASITPGVRVDRRGLTQTASASPWIQTMWPLSETLALRGGAGIYRQEPEFAEVLGTRSTPSLGLERAVHVDVGVEGRIGRTARWQMTLYDREDRHLVRLPDAEARAVDNTFVNASLTSRYQNALDGHARGIEWLVHRQTPNGFSGWASYALGFARYRDRISGETFWSDFDQRHTVNLYGNYRLSDRVSFSARFRAGSNFPTAGYWDQRGGVYYLGAERNTLRIPAYSRLDVRMNRAFAWERKRLTLFLEAINLLNADNVRFQLPSVNRRTLEATNLYEGMVPLIPSFGVLVEF
jgi:hypothetical protein